MTEGVRTSLNQDPADQDVAKPLASLDDLPDGGLLEVEAEVGGTAESLILHRDGDSVRAWLNICPHAGRRLDWAPGKFLQSKDGLLVCAAHGASFELREGACVAGPCRGDALLMVAVEVADGGVRIAGKQPSRSGSDPVGG